MEAASSTQELEQAARGGSLALLPPKVRLSCPPRMPSRSKPHGGSLRMGRDDAVDHSAGGGQAYKPGGDRSPRGGDGQAYRSGGHMNWMSTLSLRTAAGRYMELLSGGSESVMRYLLDRGGDPVAAVGMLPDSGLTPLHVAAVPGHCEAVRLLLSKGVDVDAISSCGTPLHMAASKDQDQALNILLDHGADWEKSV